jgi:hypothetical protein
MSMPTTFAAAVADAALRLFTLFEVTVAVLDWPKAAGVATWIPLTPWNAPGLVEVRPLTVFDVTPAEGVAEFTWTPVTTPPPVRLVIVLDAIVAGEPFTTMPVRDPEGAGVPPQLLHVLF